MMREFDDVLSPSKRPLFFLGNGCRYVAGLEGFIDKLDANSIPYVVNPHAHGLIKRQTPQNWGTFGFGAPSFSKKAAIAYKADMVVFLGTRLKEFQTNGWDSQLTDIPVKVHIDKNPAVFNATVSVDHCFEYDLTDFFQKYRLSSKEYREERLRLLQQIQFDLEEEEPFVKFSEEEGVHPINLMGTLSKVLPEDAVFFSDVGNSMVWTVGHLRLRAAQEFFLHLGLSSMGSGICAAIGAKAALPGRPVFACVGDATMLMQGQELFSCGLNNLPLKVFVLNDRGHGMVQHGQQIVGMPVEARFHKSVDFCLWAKSLGLESVKIESSDQLFEPDNLKHFVSEETVIFDIQIDESIVPPIGSRAQVVATQ